MALDGVFLCAVKNELKPLIGGRVEKVYQPSREEIVISIRKKNLYISANAGSARVHVTENRPDNPQVPPMFCMLLRKKIGGGRLIDIRQDGFERILFFDFECVNELGDVVKITLACEIMGRYSNIIIIDGNGKIIDSIKRVDSEMSRKRIVLPGMVYTMPPREDKLNMFECSFRILLEKVFDSDFIEPDALPKKFLSVFEGISPIVAREFAFPITGDGAHTLFEVGLVVIMNMIRRIKDDFENDMCRFYAVIIDGSLKDFSFIRPKQYGNLAEIKEFATASELLDYFYSERDRAARTKQRASDLFRLLVNLTERTTRRIAAQKQELSECAEKEKYRLFGDLISANIYRIKKGDSSAVVENFYDEDYPQIEIGLDVMKTPSQNAQYYYSEYKKRVTAEEKLTAQIAKGEEELQYLDSVFDALTRAESENDIIQLRVELRAQGYIKSSGGKAKPPKALPPIEYKSSDGFTILVGRNNAQNDWLSLKFAEKSDIWLHVQSLTGSHVIIVTEGKTPPDRTIEEAAIIAAVNSKGRNSDLVAVDYCLAKFVRKPSGAKPGKVIFTNYKTAFVKPNLVRSEELGVRS